MLSSLFRWMALVQQYLLTLAQKYLVTSKKSKNSAELERAVITVEVDGAPGLLVQTKVLAYYSTKVLAY